MNDVISFLTVSEFRTFKKAMNTLIRLGMDRTQAVDILTGALLKRRELLNRYRQENEHVIRSVSR
jgi:hypothetical protein